MTAVSALTPGSPEAATQRVARLRAEIVQQSGPNTLLWSDHGIALDVTHAHPGGLAKLLASRDTLLSELYREAAIQDRAITKARTIRAKELELARERGVPGCYLAIGRATWTERRGPKPNAPVFLRRCELVPESPAHQEFTVVLTGELEFNPALRGFLESVGGAEIPFDELVRMSMRPSGFDPAAAYDALGRWPGPPGWSIATDMWITTFPYAKLPAVTDFSHVTEALGDHPLLAALVPGATSGPAVGRTGTPDDPELMTVLDADPGQVAAVEAVRRGETIVIDSPPGTGKSQTIVNIAADLAREGRSTLVVAAAADSRAAVTGRLLHCGLGALVREAGARPAQPAHRPSQAARAAQVQSAWTSAGRELGEHVARMHRGREPWAVSVHEIQERIAAVCETPDPPRSKVRLAGAELATLRPAEAQQWVGTVRGVAERGAWPEPDAPSDPWWGADIRTQEDADRAAAAARALGASGQAQFDAVFTEAFAGVSVPHLVTLGGHGSFIADMTRIGEVLNIFRLGVFDAPLEEWTSHASGGTVERWRHGRAVKALVRPGAAAPADVDGLLRSALRARPVWQQVRGSQVMPGQVSGLAAAQAAYDRLAEHARFLGERLRGRPDLLSEPLPDLAARAAELTAQRERLAVLPAVTDDLDRAREAGLGELIEDVAARRLAPDQAAAETEFVWLASVLAHTTATDSGYARVTGDAVRAAGTRFRENDRALQRAVAAGIVADRTDGEPLISVCSPHTVGRYLSGDVRFDLVILDDAHALATADAVSALARADQAVIVGDSHLPGPSFFTATAGGVPAKGAPSTSLLADAAAIWPVHRFAWHYRSHDERLIESVGATCYPGLRTFPSPSDTGAVRIEQAPITEHDHGLVGQAVRAVVTHARLQPKESLAVLTVDPELAKRIRDGIRATADPSVAAFLGERGEEAVIVIDAARSTGLVRDAAIVVLGQNTPDLVVGAAGGQLLTAALTRARGRLTVLHTLDSAAMTQLAGDGPTRLGARLLADLLASDRPQTGPAVESTLTRDLARRLKSRGLRVREGVAPGLVDLAVRDPFTRGPVALAIQVDGPAYAALGGNRMRDRLVQEQLRRLGWRPLRILTVDLFRDPAREEARIVAAMERMAEGDMRTGPITGKGTRRASRPGTGSPGVTAAASATPGRPEQTRDDTDAGWGERPGAVSGGESAHDRWLQENRPPHWQ